MHWVLQLRNKAVFEKFYFLLHSDYLVFKIFLYFFCLSKKKPRLTLRAGTYNTNSVNALIKPFYYCNETHLYSHDHAKCCIKINIWSSCILFTDAVIPRIRGICWARCILIFYSAAIHVLLAIPHNGGGWNYYLAGKTNIGKRWIIFLIIILLKNCLWKTYPF